MSTVSRFALFFLLLLLPLVLFAGVFIGFSTFTDEEGVLRLESDHKEVTLDLTEIRV